MREELQVANGSVVITYSIPACNIGEAQKKARYQSRRLRDTVTVDLLTYTEDGRIVYTTLFKYKNGEKLSVGE